MTLFLLEYIYNTEISALWTQAKQSIAKQGFTNQNGGKSSLHTHVLASKSGALRQHKK